MRSTSMPSINSSQADAGFGVAADGDPTLPREDLTVPRPTGQQQRLEPRLEPSGARKPTYEELRTLAALYDRPVAPRRRPMKLAGIIALIFVVGTSVGFGVASLFGEKEADGRLSSPPQRLSAGHGSGTSAGELPYDGRGMETPRRAQEDSSRFNAAELPYGGNSSGNSMQEPEATVTPPTPETEATPAETARQDEIPSSPAVQAAKPAKQAAPKVENKAVAQQHRRKPAHRADKDREIERIRQQAAEELKKKTDSRRSIAESRSAGHRTGQHSGNGRKEGHGRTGRAPAMTAMLEQCEQAGNFILREQCKWQLCGGKWGKNGCPSYPPRTN